jgi:hypothetical protein
LAIGPDGNIVASATFNGGTVQIGDTVLEPVGREDIVLAKFSIADGSSVWARRYGSVQDDRITGVAVGATGDVFISGQYEASMNVGTVLLTHHGVVSNNYYWRPFFARISGTTGNTVWAKGFAPQTAALTHQDYAGGIGLDPDGNIWSGLHFVGARDFGGGATGSGILSYVAFLSFDADGNWRANQFWPAFQSEGAVLAMMGASPILGTFLNTNSTVNFGGAPLSSGMLTLAMQPGPGVLPLEHRWSESVPGAAPSSYPQLTDLAARGDKVAVVGTFRSATDFGNGPVSPGTSNNGLFLLIKRY